MKKYKEIVKRAVSVFLVLTLTFSSLEIVNTKKDLSDNIIDGMSVEEKTELLNYLLS